MMYWRKEILATFSAINLFITLVFAMPILLIIKNCCYYINAYFSADKQPAHIYDTDAGIIYIAPLDWRCWSIIIFIFQLQEKIGKGEFGDVRLGKRELTFPLCSVTFFYESHLCFGSVSDPDSIGSVDPDLGRQEWHSKLRLRNYINLLSRTFSLRAGGSSWSFKIPHGSLRSKEMDCSLFKI